jgi:cytochrome c556
MRSQHAYADADFLRRIEQQVDEAGRRLEVLAAIEQTCGALRADADLFRSEARRVHDLASKLNALAPRDTAAIGAEAQAAAAVFRAAQDLAQRAVAYLRSSREAARRDPRLRDDDGVVDAYDEAIDAVCDWHDALDALADCVLEIEADHAGAGSPAFESADDLIAALRQ